MISVDNFYWILHRVLLQPSGFDCHYHYPFGSRQNLSQFEYDGWNSRLKNHVLFFYDQEPIWTQDISNAYDAWPINWTYRTCRILANSEHSEIKKNLCAQRHMLDWYFFYHGFAALDWFRDTKYIDDKTQPTKVYLNLNHQIQNYRSYRISLISRLIEQGLLLHGNNSFHGNWSAIQQEMSDPNTLMSDYEKILALKFLRPLELPLTVDSQTVCSDFSARIGHREFTMWQSSVLHVVNETVFYHPKLHLTEKIFKPIVACRPFILVAAPGNLEYLRSYGFKTFGSWIDESYDREVDPTRRLDLITAEIQKLCGMSMSQLLSMLSDMTDVLIYNKNHFFGEFQKLIVQEMLDNFDHCISQWNNGRLETGVTLPDHDRVRSRLLQL